MDFRMVKILFSSVDLKKAKGQGQTLKTLKSKYLKNDTR